LVFGVIAPLSLLGMILGWGGRRRLLLLYFFIGGYVFSTMLYFVNSRYRLPLVPFLLLFAGYSFYWWRERIRQKRWNKIIISLPALLLLVVWVNPGLITEPRFVLNLGAGHNHLGTYYSQQGDMDRARAEFEKALQLEPYRPEAHYNLANILFKLGDLSAAEKAYEEAIRRNPFYESAHLALAMLYEQRGEEEKARQKYREIIQNLPSSTRAYLGLSKLLIANGRAEEAVEILNKAVSISPDLPEFYLFLGAAHEKSGDPTAAVAALEKGTKSVPGDGRLHLELGWRLGALPAERERSLFHLQEAVRLMPENAVAYLLLGDFYYRSGDRAGARRAWLTARELKPDDPEIEKRLKVAAGSLTR
ncbi:MAG: tetratricopeptide repeat protein, partial [PVC group bacterium]